MRWNGTLRSVVAAVVLGVGVAACGGGGGSVPAQGPMPVGVTWNGRWDTTFGPLIMEQKGDEVIGVYRYGNGILGALAGKMDGNYLRFAWAEKEGGAGKGHGVFGMNANGTFSGSWGYHDSFTDGGGWSGSHQ